ncbi:MAG: hypothetical protein ACXWV0_06320 [Flavisolibacter sp.]
MKKIIFLIILVSFKSTLIQAQITRPVSKQIKSDTTRKIIKKGVVTTPPVNNPPATVNSTAYYLTAVKVSIVTGNDNKEQPSRASIMLNTVDGGCWPSDKTTGGCGLYDFNLANTINNEFKVNSVTDISLTTAYQFPASFPGGAGEGWRYINLSLAAIQAHGVVLFVNYDPNFFLDAWKIERLTLTMEFKDLQGNAHPTMGTVSIPFINASALLNSSKRTLKCETDRFLMPKS